MGRFHLIEVPKKNPRRWGVCVREREGGRDHVEICTVAYVVLKASKISNQVERCTVAYLLLEAEIFSKYLSNNLIGS